MSTPRRSADRAKLRDRPALESGQRQIQAPCPGAAPRIRWRRIDTSNLPQASGVYAIRSGARWLYIGQSQNIADRMRATWHPAQITWGLRSLVMTYHWQPHPKAGLLKLERALIRQHAPEWNGGTSFGAHWDQWGPACDLWLPPTAEQTERVNAARGLLFSGAK